MLIVLEGLDGAGKSTQIDLLRGLLAEHGIASEFMHFPRFDAPVYGELLARFLRGEFGGADSLDSYLVALLFAGDRADASATIRGWLEQGRAVILDRYVLSNIAYQCAKLGDPQAREALREWILRLEYGYHAIPQPDLELFLDVPLQFVESKLTQTRRGEDRAYLQGGSDIHEASLDLQRRVREVYLAATGWDDSLRVVDCADAEGLMAAPEVIFARIAERLAPLLETPGR